MNKKIATLLAAPALCTSLVAAANTTPDFFGTLNFGVQKIESTSDIDGEAFEASVGVKGNYSVDDFTLIYQLEADLANATNMDDGQGDIEIKNALVVLPSQVGAFIIAPRVESGHQNDMYEMVDIFEINAASDVTLWGQPEAATSVFAYKTPTYQDTYFVAAALTLNQSGTSTNHNQNNLDALALRLLHKGENLYLGMANVFVAKEQFSGSKDYNRPSFTAGYKTAELQLGATLEQQMDHPSGSDASVMGVAADMSMGNGLSAGVGYTERDSENNTLDDNMLAFITRKDLAENIQAWAEVALYDEGNDNYSAGIKVNL